MRKLTVLVSLFFLTAAGHSQNTVVRRPCSSPEASRFDFRVGNRDLSWNDTSRGTNTVLKIMDGCTVHENFNSPGNGYSGSSWSVYNPGMGAWQQTWIDNKGGYLTLTGKMETGEMRLYTEARHMPDGTEKSFRMVYFHITPQKFDWEWESSTGKGTTWETQWLIHYVRKG
jgi:hypothetical protein